MTRVQDNYLNMENSVINLFDQNPAIVESNFLISTHLKTIRGIRDETVIVALKQKNSSSKGPTEAKERSRSALEERIFITGVRLRTYAAVNEDTILAALLQFTRSSLSRLKMHDLLTLGRAVEEAAALRLESLQPFSIDRIMLDALLANVDELATLYAERDTTVDEGMEATEHLVKLFSNARKALKQMDDLVEGYVTDSVFATTYRKSRKTHDR